MKIKINSMVKTPEDFLSMQAVNGANGKENLRIYYMGKNSHGQFRVKAYGAKLLVDGAIYALKELLDHQGKKKVEKFLLDVSPGFDINGSQNFYHMICDETDQPMLLKGDFKLYMESVKR